MKMNFQEMLKKGIENYNKKIYDKASIYFNNLIQEDQCSVEGYFRLAQTQLKLGNFEEAEKICNLGMRKCPNDFQSFSVFADITDIKKDYIVSEQRWKNVRLLFPDNEVGYYKGADNYLKLNKVDEAIELCYSAENNKIAKINTYSVLL